MYSKPPTPKLMFGCRKRRKKVNILFYEKLYLFSQICCLRDSFSVRKRNRVLSRSTICYFFDENVFHSFLPIHAPKGPLLTKAKLGPIAKLLICLLILSKNRTMT